jgi:hypothetical protein
MRKLKLFITFLALTLISCERDDICAETTATTPRLLIEFYDSTSPDDLKSVFRLTAYGEALFIDDNGNVTQPTEASNKIVIASVEPLSYLFNTNSTSAALPLLIGPEDEFTTVRFVLEKFTNFRLDEDTTTNSNTDIIEISYQTEFVYVSRACGYKSIFKNLNITLVTDEDAWINNINIEETTIENENTVHVRINH